MPTREKAKKSAKRTQPRAKPPTLVELLNAHAVRVSEKLIRLPEDYRTKILHVLSLATTLKQSAAMEALQAV